MVNIDTKYFDFLYISILNSPVEYKGKKWKLDTIIVIKTQELGRFLLGEPESMNFTVPIPDLKIIDIKEMRKKILELTSNQAQQLGINKSTIHYLRKNALNSKKFKVYKKILNRIS